MDRTHAYLVRTRHGFTNLHTLKSWPQHFMAVVSGAKKSELRLNDRNFRAGDILRLEEWDFQTSEFTGRDHCVVVTHIGEKYAGVLDPEYVLLSFEPTARPE